MSIVQRVNILFRDYTGFGKEVLKIFDLQGISV